MSRHILSRITIILIFLLLILIMGCQRLALEMRYLNKPGRCHIWKIDKTQSYFRDQITFSMLLSSSGQLIIKNDVGSIIVRPSQWENMYVRGDIYATTFEQLDKIRITPRIQSDPTSNSSINYVTVTYALADSFSGFTNLEVYVPSDLKDLEIQSESATIRIEELNAGLKIYNPCGDIMAQNIVGDVEIWAENGNILLDSKNGFVDVRNVLGDITVFAEIQNSKTYDIQSNSGSIHFIPQNNIGTVSLKTVSGHVDVGARLGTNPTSFGSSNSQIEGGFFEEDATLLTNRNQQSNKYQTQWTEVPLGAGSATIHLETMTGDIIIR